MNTGGPAFPVSALIYNDDGNDPTTIIHDGMELRDYFAAKAMQGIISKMPFYLDEKQDLEKILNAVSRGSYSYADAMLKAREQ